MGSIASHKQSTKGGYTFQFEATRSNGMKSTDQVKVYLFKGNIPPQIVFDVSDITSFKDHYMDAKRALTLMELLSHGNGNSFYWT